MRDWFQGTCFSLLVVLIAGPWVVTPVYAQ